MAQLLISKIVCKTFCDSLNIYKILYLETNQPFFFFLFLQKAFITVTIEFETKTFCTVDHRVQTCLITEPLLLTVVDGGGIHVPSRSGTFKSFTSHIQLEITCYQLVYEPNVPTYVSFCELPTCVFSAHECL